MQSRSFIYNGATRNRATNLKIFPTPSDNFQYQTSQYTARLKQRANKKYQHYSKGSEMQ
jgi:hypothetical protein